jgi:LmbE family N-acetylglucosaminyl deacetylase
MIERNSMGNNKSALVMSAHAADFVWRAGGAIALHQKAVPNIGRREM